MVGYRCPNGIQEIQPVVVVQGVRLGCGSRAPPLPPPSLGISSPRLCPPNSEVRQHFFHAIMVTFDLTSKSLCFKSWNQAKLRIAITLVVFGRFGRTLVENVCNFTAKFFQKCRYVDMRIKGVAEFSIFTGFLAEIAQLKYNRPWHKSRFWHLPSTHFYKGLELYFVWVDGLT